MNKIIEVKHASVNYDMNLETNDAIHDVSLDLYKGEFACIIGPSGCGKSTLLKAIAGFVFPYEGDILMHNEKVVGPNSERGVVFQTPNLFPWYDVKHNVSMGPKFDKLSDEEVNRVCDKYLDQVELSQYKNSKVFELSGGEKQRIAIARTLASHPEVILMDEPFSALDSFTRKKMQIMIRRLWIQNKVTIFFVTHDIDEALLLGTKIYVMRRGKNDIIKSYNSDYTHRLYKDTKLPVHQEDKYIKLKDEILSLLED